MVSVLQPARALVDPVGGVRQAVEARRWAWPLVLLCLATSLSGAAFAVRWDGTAQVVRELQMKGELAKASEREVSEDIETAERIKLVGGVAKGVFVTPLLVLGLALVLKLCGWLFGTPAPFVKAFTAAAIALLPIAVFHLVFALVALSQHQISDAQALTLVPSSLLALKAEAPPRLAKLFGAIDFFHLWAVGLLALGFSAASGMRLSRAALLSVVLFAAWVGVFVIGLPAMAAANQ